jgi:hypothetical protein
MVPISSSFHLHFSRDFSHSIRDQESEGSEVDLDAEPQEPLAFDPIFSMLMAWRWFMALHTHIYMYIYTSDHVSISNIYIQRSCNATPPEVYSTMPS